MHALRADLADKIRRVKNRTQAADARDKVLEALLEVTEIPTPEAPPDTRAEQVTDPHVGKDGFLDLFGRPARQLTLAESALIAGLARAPGALSPWNHLDDAVARSHVVLGRMRDEGFITRDQEQAARRARPPCCRGQ